jgi:dTDP-4-dehydrorhamnose 3,5-epimerase-like enzyme
MFSQKVCKVVTTKDSGGQENGWLMEVASSRDGWNRFLDNAQVYVTILLPGKKKGWHLHHKKASQLTCIKGKVVIAIWDGKNIEELVLNANKPVTVRVPKEQAICFYNPGPEEAYILNLCSPPYDPQNPEQEDLDLTWQPKI